MAAEVGAQPEVVPGGPGEVASDEAVVDLGVVAAGVVAAGVVELVKALWYRCHPTC